MGRLALRPALRAYAHAPAAAPVGWVNTKSMAFDGTDDLFASAVGGGLGVDDLARAVYADVR